MGGSVLADFALLYLFFLARLALVHASTNTLMNKD